MQLNLTNEELALLERLAAAAFSIVEIAEVMEVDSQQLQDCIEMPGHSLRKAYRSGVLRRQLELRERIFKDAHNGSSPAQTIAHKLLEELTIKNNLR